MVGMVKKLFCLFPIALIFLSSCVSTEHVDNKDIEDKAIMMMKCIVNEDAEGLFAFYSDYMKESYKNESLKEIQQIFDYIDGKIVSYEYQGNGGGKETIHDGKIYYCTCYPEFEFTTDNNKKYAIDFSLYYVWYEYPEGEGLHMIEVCKDGDWSTKLVAGKNYEKN